MKQFLESTAARPFRYLFSGGVAWLVDLAVFTFFLPGGGIILAQLAARTAGAVVSFIGHKVFVFHARDYHPAALARQTFHFVLLWLFSYIMSTLALIGLIDKMHWNVLAAKLLVEVFILLINYRVMKLFIFHAADNKGSTE